MQQPIVAYPKREGRFMLRTDACLGDKDNVGGLGAVLLQQQSTCGDRKSKGDGEDHVQQQSTAAEDQKT
jgi:hypothetical protein